MGLKHGVGCGLDRCRSEEGPVAGCCEHGNEPACAVQGGEFLEWLSDYQILNLFRR
jgi:hypothetical protein